MPIKLKIKSNQNQSVDTISKKEQKQESSVKINLQIRKTLDDKLIITDHEDVDVVIDQKNGKVFAFSTDMKNSDKTYYTQDRFFKHLIKKGIIDGATVKSGNIYGCIEGKILEPNNPNINKIDMTIITISNWIDEERPSFLYQKEKKEEWEEDVVNPDNEETTPLGKVPHKDMKTSEDEAIFNVGTSPISRAQQPYSLYEKKSIK